MNTQVASDRPEECERSNPRISDHGARVAAGRIGCTVEEFRAHEAAGERWCALGEHWAVKGNADRCRACQNADARQRYVPQRAHITGLRNVRYAGPAYSLTPKGAATTMPSVASPEGRPDAEAVAYPDRLGSGHQNCPASIRDLCLGHLPDGWIRERKEAAG